MKAGLSQKAAHAAAGEIAGLERTSAGNTVGRIPVGEFPTVLSIADAKRLGPPHEGLIFVRESLGTPTSRAAIAARDFEAGTSGAFSEMGSRSRVVPALRYQNPN